MMNNEDLQVQFKVIGFFGAPRNTTTLGTYDCIRAAQIRVDTWQHDRKFEYTHFDELKIVKHSQVTVQTSKQALVQSPVDYERQGVVQSNETLRSNTQDLRNLRYEDDLDDLRNLYASLRADLSVVETDTIPFLEERFVGLRHELLNDMEDLQEDVEDLRDAVSATADIDVLENAMKHEVAGLRREMESLRKKIEEDS